MMPQRQGDDKSRAHFMHLCSVNHKAIVVLIKIDMGVFFSIDLPFFIQISNQPHSKEWKGTSMIIVVI